MPRARNIKPGVMQNEDLADLHPLTRLLFIHLWMLADRDGRLEDRPKRIKAEALPYDDADVDAMLYDLGDKGFLLRYENDGERYIQILNFRKHQRPHSNEAKSIIPAFDIKNSVVSERPANQGKQDLPPCSDVVRSDSLIDLYKTKEPKPIPTTPAEKPAGVAGAAKPRVRKATPAGRTAATWDAYAHAFHDRYGTDPVRNATVNGQLANFVARIGGEEAPHVARYYVGHNATLYVRAGHPTGLLVRDAEKLRMEWATHRQVPEAPPPKFDPTEYVNRNRRQAP
ncbi:hypothetical protein [Cupriavidus alkaliphilus]|uniref:hypothetical protein n=1 Tax=Cupriavidus alkaliphilus TaxID=942866 RepID=UPI0016217CED|nr:hypothetical protein [Cupriavidus alkaliphilus]MBB2915882.1 hypothetical protein [Cupriavidus alkaliphilus]